jgi:hypothetical protein
MLRSVSSCAIYLSKDMLLFLKKEDQMDGACGMHRGEGKCMHGCDGETEVIRPLGRPRHRWENIKMHHREI